LAIIKAKRGMGGKAVKITNMKMLCMFQMIASITTKTIRNSQKKKQTERERVRESKRKRERDNEVNE